MAGERCFGRPSRPFCAAAQFRYNESVKATAIVFTSVLLLATFALPQTLPAIAAPLSAGKTPGTFHYEQRVHISFTAEPAPSIKISCLRSADGASVRGIEVSRRDELMLIGDFAPGTYRATLEPVRSNAHLPDYALGGIADFHIDKHGVVHYLYGRTDSVQFVQTVAGMRPADGSVADEAKPVLRWQPVAGAVYYIVSWVNGDLPMAAFDKKNKTTQCEYKVTDELVGTEDYGWEVSGYATDNRLLASGIGWFRRKGSPPTEIVPATPATQPSRSFVGLQVVDYSVTTGGKRIDLAGGRHGWLANANEFSHQPGVYVRAILPSSPAIDADLLPGDVIVKLDGKPVESDDGISGDARKFGEHIRQLRPGTVVKLTIRRDEGPEQEVEVKVASASALPK